VAADCDLADAVEERGGEGDAEVAFLHAGELEHRGENACPGIVVRVGAYSVPALVRCWTIWRRTQRCKGARERCGRRRRAVLCRLILTGQPVRLSQGQETKRTSLVARNSVLLGAPRLHKDDADVGATMMR
jgi:hypothetical protein